MLSSTATSDHFAVTDTSAQSAALVAGTMYRVAVTVDSYMAIGSNPTASAADNNHIVFAGRPVHVHMLEAHKIALIRIGANSGVATVSRAMTTAD